MEKHPEEVTQTRRPTAGYRERSMLQLQKVTASSHWRAVAARGDVQEDNAPAFPSFRSGRQSGGRSNDPSARKAGFGLGREAAIDQGFVHPQGAAKQLVTRLQVAAASDVPSVINPPPGEIVTVCSDFGEFHLKLLFHSGGTPSPSQHTKLPGL